MIEIRLARPAEIAVVGEQTVAAYAEFVPAADPYRSRLADAADRADVAELWVALQDGVPVGSVTVSEAGGPYADVAREGELEFRMLGVAPAGRGLGVGAALVRHVLDLGRARGRQRVVMSTQPNMVSARRIYDACGFELAPERAWSPIAGVDLQVLVREL
ncbi:GNAT family N-acetyltransferase [Tomitella biformata]|uniref:GNAT family N-acetyltransferase n=1 Tax=Tomitella biformata TaxID=630403 RepID=UPI0004671251|nr:GNAT family N-acetyltransferase [Tomitella biformata]